MDTFNAKFDTCTEAILGFVVEFLVLRIWTHSREYFDSFESLLICPHHVHVNNAILIGHSLKVVLEFWVVFKLLFVLLEPLV